jgi:hypothetical protein
MRRREFWPQVMTPEPPRQHALHNQEDQRRCGYGDADDDERCVCKRLHAAAVGIVGADQLRQRHREYDRHNSKRDEMHGQEL